MEKSEATILQTYELCSKLTISSDKMSNFVKKFKFAVGIDQKRDDVACIRNRKSFTVATHGLEMKRDPERKRKSSTIEFDKELRWPHAIVVSYLDSWGFVPYYLGTAIWRSSGDAVDPQNSSDNCVGVKRLEMYRPFPRRKAKWNLTS